MASYNYDNEKNKIIDYFDQIMKQLIQEKEKIIPITQFITLTNPTYNFLLDGSNHLNISNLVTFLIKDKEYQSKIIGILFRNFFIILM